MKYMLLLYYAPDAAPAEDTPEADARDRRLGRRHRGDGEAGVAARRRRAGGRSRPRRRSGLRDGERVLTDGPFAETKEILFSFYVIDVADLDAAPAWAAKMPNADVRLGRDPPAVADRAGCDRPVTADVAAALERAYRDEWAAVLATLTRQVGGDLGLAEDAVQDAFVAAAADVAAARRPRPPGRLADRRRRGARRSTACAASARAAPAARARAPRASSTASRRPTADDDPDDEDARSTTTGCG